MNKKYSYNVFSFAIFAILLAGTFSFFTFADDTKLTLFEDFDRDGLSNAEEESLGTDPKEADSDGDGYSDGVELESGYDPLVAAPGDRLIEEENITIKSIDSNTTNVTQKISEDVVEFLADAQEEGKTDITPEELSEVVAKSVDEEVEFVELPIIDPEEINIKEQDYENTSNKKEREREDAITYFTTISYIFISNFPQGFFERSSESFAAEVMQNLTNFSTSSLTDYAFFEDIAENAMSAEKQMDDVDVPEDLLEIHMEGLQLLRSAGALYEAGDYKKASTDIAPVIATLTQIQGLLTSAMDFQEHVEQKAIEYEIDDIILDF